MPIYLSLAAQVLPILQGGSALYGTLLNARAGLGRLVRVPAYGPILVQYEIVYADTRQVYRRIETHIFENPKEIITLGCIKLFLVIYYF